VSDAARQGSSVSGNQVLAAGLAAALAAFVTSRFGVAGTLLGAALTAMIITGGSAILKAYLESVTGNVRKVPHRLRERRNRWRAGRTAEPETLPGRPDLRDNFAGRMRAALDWFSHLPPLMRRSVLIKGLVAAVIAFVIGMGLVFGAEKVIGNSLSCGLWANCPEGATPGIHLGGGDGTGANSTLSFGRARTNAAPGYEARDPAFQQNPSQQIPSDRQRGPDYRPAPSRNEPGGGVLEPDQPLEPEVPAQPETPNSASPASQETPNSASPASQESVPPAEEERAPAQEAAPPDAQQAPSQ
jgi:hypothetical protein